MFLARFLWNKFKRENSLKIIGLLILEFTCNMKTWTDNIQVHIAGKWWCVS